MARFIALPLSIVVALAAPGAEPCPGAQECQTDEAEPLAAVTDLLQRKLGFQSPQLHFSAEPTPLLTKARPLRWLHIPKTGSSWFNVLVHTPSLCPLLPQGFLLCREQFCRNCDEYDSGLLDHLHKRLHFSSYCPGSFGDPQLGMHYAVGHEEEQYMGHGVMLLRNPQTRLVSSYNHHLWDWPAFLEPPKDISSYVELIQGCTVRALTRPDPNLRTPNSCHIDRTLESLRPGEVEKAKKMLDTFVFVGIMEDWDLSVCLWHVKFGGQCHGSDLANIRKAGSPNVTLSNPNPLSLEDLDGFIDKADTELYEYGQELFRRDMIKYGVSWSACQPCFDHASTHWNP